MYSAKIYMANHYPLPTGSKYYVRPERSCPVRGIPRQRSLRHDPAYTKDGKFIGDLLVGLRHVAPLVLSEDADIAQIITNADQADAPTPDTEKA